MAIINAIDVSIAGEVKSKGIAYYRIEDGLYEFLKEVGEKEKIIGFEYEPGSRNFGLILGE